MKLKYFEDEIYPIPYLEFHLPFFYLLYDSVYLAGFENISYNNSVRLKGLREIEDFFEFTFTNIGGIVWLITFLERL